MRDTADRLWDTLERYVSAEGIELDDVEVLGRGPRRVVRVTVDAAEGLDVERIAEVSRGLSRLLDGEDTFDGPYTLEVSSPGLERRLRRVEHYRKSLGREVVVKTAEAVDGARSHRGILRDIDDNTVVVTVDDVDRTIPLSTVTRARTVFRWEAAPKPGKRGKG
jgi:ribosome maturation factor RimP